MPRAVALYAFGSAGEDVAKVGSAMLVVLVLLPLVFRRSGVRPVDVAPSAMVTHPCCLRPLARHVEGAYAVSLLLSILMTRSPLAACLWSRAPRASLPVATRS